MHYLYVIPAEVVHYATNDIAFPLATRALEHDGHERIDIECW